MLTCSCVELYVALVKRLLELHFIWYVPLESLSSFGFDCKQNITQPSVIRAGVYVKLLMKPESSMFVHLMYVVPPKYPSFMNRFMLATVNNVTYLNCMKGLNVVP